MNYKVTLKTTDGITSYTVDGPSIQYVSAQLDSQYQHDSHVINYTVENVPQMVMTPKAYHSLINGTIGLMVCLLVLVYAEYRIRKWLKE